MSKKKQKQKKLKMSLQRQVKILASVVLGLVHDHDEMVSGVGHLHLYYPKFFPIVDKRLIESIATGEEQELNG